MTALFFESGILGIAIGIIMLYIIVAFSGIYQGWYEGLLSCVTIRVLEKLKCNNVVPPHVVLKDDEEETNNK